MQVSYEQALLRHNQNLPRYTSYPPANFFTQTDSSVSYHQMLAALSATQPISLYLHIPFCPKMCWFCGCHTQATARYDPIPHYLDLLCDEIDMVSGLLPGHNLVAHIHFGGGSPTMLSPHDFSRVMNHIHQKFSVHPDCAIAIEIDPRQVTIDKIKAYRDAHVHRVSLGVQDIDPKVMAAINRVQPFDMTRHVVDLCRNHDLHHINIDLVYGLPHQTPESIIKTVDAVCTLTPDRLALFGYAHVPWMKKHMRLIADADLPTHQNRFHLFETASSHIEKYGYIPIGIDHFCKMNDPLAVSQKSGLLKRNFQGYVPASEDLPIIGLGVSSISQTPTGYAQNTPQMPHYRDWIQSNRLPIAKAHILTPDDFLRATIIERLMCDTTVNIPAIAQKHPAASINMKGLRHDLSELIHDQLVDITDDDMITVHHRLAIRMIAAIFDAYRVKQMGDQSPPKRHATAI